jgi:hypothetical protein
VAVSLKLIYYSIRCNICFNIFKYRRGPSNGCVTAHVGITPYICSEIHIVKDDQELTENFSEHIYTVTQPLLGPRLCLNVLKQTLHLMG